MRLISNCPTCGKPAEIRGKTNIGKLTCLVYFCGHVEMVDPTQVALTKEDLVAKLSNDLKEEMAKNEPLERVRPVSHAMPYGLSEKTLNEKSTALTSGSAAALLEEVQPSGRNPLNLDIDEFAHLGPKYSPEDDFKSICLTKEAYEFQKRGVIFAERANLSCLIADPMGLGKTIQALLILRRNWEKMTPCLIPTKPNLVLQWTRELKTWTSNHIFSAMPVLNKAHLMPGFSVYVMSMDTLRSKGVEDKLAALGIKSLIVDESHSFKDPSSARTTSLIKLIQRLNIQYRIFLSGTPIKNRADEYFTVLNLLAPQHFRSKAQFQSNWLIPNEKGVYTRLAPWRLEQFKKLISHWVIRREKEEVLTNLPPLSREKVWVTIDDPKFKAMYNKTLDLFSNWLNDPNESKNSTNMLGWLARIRALTGEMKAQAACEWAAEFLDSTDESLAIGIHHKSVRDTLYYVMDATGYSPLKFSGEDSSYQKDYVIRAFERGDNRLLIINQVAGGVGLNLQSCANALVLERMWNSADEEQFEGRFHRDGQKKAVKATYMMASGTIDEWFDNLVETKRQILGETLEGWNFAEDMNSMKELAEKTIAGRL